MDEDNDSISSDEKDYCIEKSKKNEYDGLEEDSGYHSEELVCDQEG